MVKLDKIYTRGGDQGSTSLGDGKRVRKDNLRVSCYGEIDEVNAIIGISMIYSSKKTIDRLKIIQNDLFDIGADLCVPENSEKIKLRVSETQISYLESEIDEMNKELKSLNSFILPGGTKASSYLHLARCVTRRAERSISKLLKDEVINEVIFKYVNRLSDFLFVASRYENKENGDILWEPGKNQKRSKLWNL